MAGADIRTVQELLGHKTIAITVRYAYLAPQHQLVAVERLDSRSAGSTDIRLTPKPFRLTWRKNWCFSRPPQLLGLLVSARVAKLADARDLKSVRGHPAPSHHAPHQNAA
jgi:hypothetical protein